MKRTALVMTLAGLLSACGPAENKPKSDAVEANPETKKTAEEVAIDSGETGGSATGQESNNKEELAKKEEPKQKLNLNLPENLSTGGADAPLDDEPKMLPDMFAKKESRTSIGGGVHRDQENPDLINSIDGAEVSIEIKTD